jgi:probable phosphoglycerate mutase
VTQLHFVRHGETAWNAERRIQGQTHDVQLSDRGREQAAAIAEELASASAGLIITSDLARTVETARIIAARIDAPILQEAALRERHFGIAQGRLYEDVAGLLTGWRTDVDSRVEGGESNREMYGRVSQFLDRLATQPPCSSIVVVTHGGTMNAALAYLRGLPVERMEWQRFDNCALETVYLDGQRAAGTR